MKRITREAAILLTGLVSLGFGGSVALAEESPGVEAAVGLYSQYIWRGFELSSDSVVLQPELTMGYKGFSLGFWSNIDTNLHEDLRNANSSRFQLNETDITLAYDWSLGITDLSVGYIYYSLDGASDSQELFLSAGLATILSPTLTVYREVAHAPGWYVNLGVSHSVPLTDLVALDLGASVGYLDDTDSGDFHDGLISASVTCPLTERLSVSPELYYSFALSSKAKDRIEAGSISGRSNFLYGGVSVSFAF
jgi:uncharacterized protein (TIGR02001 family)